jgi:PKD repeat protein
VTFDASGSSDPDGSIERYIWQIDGATRGGEGETIDRTFETEGEYEVTLVVVDDNGARDTTVTTVEVEPEPNQAPTAVAEASPQSGEAPLDVTFDASGSSDADGSIDRYIWQVEGATPGGGGQTIDRTFRTEGEYEATLITVDDDGARDRDTVTVSVERRSLG